MLTSARSGLVRQSEHFVSQRKHDTDGYNIIPYGYCTYRNRSDDGQFAFNLNTVSDHAIVSKFYPVFTFHDADSRFMTEYLNTSQRVRQKLSVLAVGTSQVVLSFETFRNAVFPVPSFAEQQKIAQFIRVLNCRIEKQQILIASLKSYKRGVSNAIFSHSVTFQYCSEFSSTEWCALPFHQVFDLLNSNTLSRAELNYSDGEIKNIHYGDVLIKYGAVVAISSSTVPFVNADAVLPRSKHDYLLSGDIVIADTAEDLSAGKATEIKNDSGIKCVAGLHTIACRPRLSFVPGYLGHFLNSEFYHNQLHPLIQGTKVSSIARTALMDTTVSFPPPPVQAKISVILTMIDKRIGAEEKRLVLLNECKKSMLQQLFV